MCFDSVLTDTKYNNKKYAIPPNPCITTSANLKTLFTAMYDMVKLLILLPLPII